MTRETNSRNTFVNYPPYRPPGEGESCLAWARPAQSDVPVRRETLALEDGCETLVLHHAPVRALLPPVLYLHGIQSHPGWFVGSAHALARQGRDVFQVTRRGSGLATIGRGDARSTGRLLRDVGFCVDHILRRTGARQVALVGVSWGGKLLTAWLLRQPRTASQISSLTLVAPGICPRVRPALGTRLAVMACRWLWPGRLFDIPLSDVSLFTDNPVMRRYLEDDRHRLMRGTARLLWISGVLDWLVAHGRRGALTVPTTLLLASRDRIIDNAACQAAVERLAAGRARVLQLDGAHTLEFEHDQGPLLDALLRAVT